MLSPGRMRHTFTMESTTGGTQNRFGEAVPSREMLGNFRGQLTTLSGRLLQLAQANALTATASHVIDAWYSATVAPELVRLRLADGDRDRIFTINYVDDVNNEHSQMRVFVTEVRKPRG